MSDFAVSGNWFIYPTYGSAGEGAGAEPYKGSYHSELQLGSLLSGLAGASFVFSGFSVPGSSVNLNLAVPLGVAMISGRLVTIPGSTTVTVTASQTNYIYLKLEKDADGYVLSAAFEVNITGTAPADSVPIARAVADSSTITTTTDLRPATQPVGSANRMVVYSTAGTFEFIPKFTGKHKFIVIGAGGGGGNGVGYITTTTNYAAGGGGGGGAMTVGTLDLTVGVPISVVVGAAGTGRANNTSAQDGVAGGASSASTLTANGGAGGVKAITTTGGAGGAGGAASSFGTATFSFAGQNGTAGANASGGASLPGGNGGNGSGFAGLTGGVGNTNFNPTVAPTSTFPGGGGGGGVGEYNSPFGAGIGPSTESGAGGPGLVIVFW